MEYLTKSAIASPWFDGASELKRSQQEARHLQPTLPADPDTGLEQNSAAHPPHLLLLGLVPVEQPVSDVPPRGHPGTPRAGKHLGREAAPLHLPALLLCLLLRTCTITQRAPLDHSFEYDLCVSSDVSCPLLPPSPPPSPRACPFGLH